MQIFSVEYYKYGFVKNWCMLKINLVYYLYWKKQLLEIASVGFFEGRG